jgi:putative ABC transport system permease protein
MLITNLTIAWRHLLKHKSFSFINISGLAVGIACALLIVFHVKEELSYDKGFSKADRIFRITNQEKGTDTRHWAATAPPMGGLLQQYCPEIEKVVRLHRPYPYQLFSYTGEQGTIKRFEEKGGFFADPDIVTLFDLQFTHGSPVTALSETDAIVLTEELAKKYFGSNNPLGKVLQDDVRKLPLKVTGVVKAFPFASHLHFDYLLSMSTVIKYIGQDNMENRGWSGFYTYVLLKNERSKKAVEAKMPSFLVSFYKEEGMTPAEILSTTKYHLQPITDIHLHSKLEKEMYPNSDITYVYIFSIAALFILSIAAVNFVNISTALAFNRMKEIGLRKVVGAGRSQLIRQFLGESFLITLLATVLAFVLLQPAIPFYNNIASKSFHFNEVLSWPNLGLVLLLVAVLGLLAGLYPAWFVSRFNAIHALKGKKDTGSSVHFVRKGLIVFQFVVSVFMIFSTIIIYRQLNMFHQKDLGFDREQVIAVTMYGDMWEKFGSLRQEVRKNPAITDFSIISVLPGERFGMQPFLPLGVPEGDVPGCRIMWSDENLLRTLNIRLVAGRNFFNQFPDIRQKEFILNEAAVKALHLKDPVGRRVSLNRDTGEVVGVIKDFNFASLHSPIEPLVIQYNPYNTNYLLIKVQPGQIPSTLHFLESKFKSLMPASVFTYTFIDEKLNQLYASENRLSQLFKAFAALAIFISCLGLFGLSAYSARLRIKEVGIHKVLGASITRVTILLSKDFIALVLIATLIAWPLAWYTMHQWLEGFAYRIDINIWVFVLSGILALLVALVTVSYQAVKTALLNPVENLRSEV